MFGFGKCCKTPELVVTTAPLYEYREIWAEEAGALNANSAEWSFGNGATGYMGLPIDEGWEAVQLGFQADTYPSTATVSVDIMTYSAAVPGPAAANSLASIDLADARDGGGDTNNAYKIVTLDNPVAIPAGVIGFHTRQMAGAISDGRVYARLRRQIGEYVTGVSFEGYDESALPADDGTVYGDYVIQNWRDNGFFNTDQMNGQLQVFNTSTAAGEPDWQLRFDTNYDITQFTVNGATLVNLESVNNGDTVSYVATLQGSIPGNNGNVQIAIQGTRVSGNADSSASHSEEAIYI